MKRLWEKYGWILAILAIALPSFWIGTDWNDGAIRRLAAERDSLKQIADTVDSVGIYYQMETVYPGWFKNYRVVVWRSDKQGPPDSVAIYPYCLDLLALKKNP